MSAIPALCAVFFVAWFHSFQPLEETKAPGRRTLAMGEESGPLDPAVFQDAVTKLQEIGVISDPQFWMDNAKPGKFIDVNPVRELVIAAARKYEEVDGVEQALDVLHKNKILLNIEKWNTDLVNSPKVAGGAVSLLIIALAKSIN